MYSNLRKVYEDAAFKMLSYLQDNGDDATSEVSVIEALRTISG
jgi:hypothetical protein